ncbi:MAG: NAD(P)H-hydrate epimerase [Candidatus Omnitrophota bacterium]
MKTVTAKQMKRMDAIATERYGIPASILMENAGRSACDEAVNMLSGSSAGRIAVICGYGNNGGDGFVCARHLVNRGYRIAVYMAGEKKNFSEESGMNYRILRKMSAPVKSVKGAAGILELKKGIAKCDLIIDAVFGIGLHGEIGEFYRKLFDALNKSKAPILSLDIPSGLDADTGKPLGCAIKADRTITFGLLKKGMANRTAHKFTGKISVGDISLPLLYNRRTGE